jgi:hypothetical protein
MGKIFITILVHGTNLPQITSHIRPVHDFFFCPPGLLPANDLDEKFQFRRIAQLLDSADKTEFAIEHFYLFGWSGKLRFEARRKAADELLSHLSLLQRDLLCQGLQPLIRIITHSHGGNVALYLKEAAHANNSTLIIDELILLACPVQKETEEYIKAPIFKNIYSIHSHRDLLQVLDPQGVHNFLTSLNTVGLELTLAHLKQIGPIFSARHFDAGENIVQLNVKHPHREFFHIEFLLPPFITQLPSLLTLMRNHKKEKIAPCDHTYILGG